MFDPSIPSTWKYKTFHITHSNGEVSFRVKIKKVVDDKNGSILYLVSDKDCIYPWATVVKLEKTTYIGDDPEEALKAKEK